MSSTESEFDIAPLLGDVFDGLTLSQERAEWVMGHLMDAQLSQMQAAALLAALRTRGETVDEIIGFARAMRARAVRVEKYLNERGMRILAALDEVAARRGAKPAEVALAWVIAREGVTAPIASATSLEQLASLVRAVHLPLEAGDVAALDAASA